MSYSDLIARMRAGGVVVIDGATGTELERRGALMNDDAWCGLVSLTHRDTLEAVHQAYIAAGAEAITANTFAGSGLMLGQAGYGNRVREINLAAVEAALSAREKAGRPEVVVAGSLSHMLPTPPNGDRAGRRSDITDQMMADAFGELAEVLKEGGCELILLEMMFEPQRLAHAVAAAQATGLPMWCGFSVRAGDDGAVLSYTKYEDQPFAEVAALTRGAGFDAAGVMHSAPNVIGPALAVLADHFDGPLTAYPDSGFFKMPHWQFEDVISPAELCGFSTEWVAQGARALGGCCGLSPEHIEALAPLKRAGSSGGL